MLKKKHPVSHGSCKIKNGFTTSSFIILRHVEYLKRVHKIILDRFDENVKTKYLKKALTNPRKESAPEVNPAI